MNKPTIFDEEPRTVYGKCYVVCANIGNRKPKRIKRYAEGWCI